MHQLWSAQRVADCHGYGDLVSSKCWLVWWLDVSASRTPAAARAWTPAACSCAALVRRHLKWRIGGRHVFLCLCRNNYKAIYYIIYVDILCGGLCLFIVKNYDTIFGFQNYTEETQIRHSPNIMLVRLTTSPR